MADVMRWRYGDTNPVSAAVDAATVIEIGDLVYQEVDDARPASAQADLGTEAQNQEGFHDKFLGVAMQASRNGDTAPIRVATSGVFEFVTAAAAYELGALVGLVGATTLADQELKAVATENLAVGRVAKRVNPAGTAVYVEIVSTVMRGGPQAMA
jgi:hypothetical protein